MEVSDYFAELYVAGRLADAGWNVYFPHRDKGFDFIISKPPAEVGQLIRPVQVKGKYPTDEKGDKMVYGYIGRVIAPATLARAHIEAAAWAAYAYEELLKVAETTSSGRLRRLPPKMLYGTAIARDAKRLPPDDRDPFWLEATSVMNAIDALDRFFGVATGLPGTPLRVLYATLSDYAHPAMRGVRHLFGPNVETLGGWTIAYSCDERATAAEADLILRSLLTSMRFGHAASLLMRLGTVEETETDIKYFKPSESDEMEIKRHIIFGETAQNDVGYLHGRADRALALLAPAVHRDR